METVLTVAEVACVLRAVDRRRTMTARAIRYYARTGMVEPTGRVAGERGSRLYTLTDVGAVAPRGPTAQRGGRAARAPT